MKHRSLTRKRLAAGAAALALSLALACPAFAACPCGKHKTTACTAKPKARVTCAQREADRREAAYAASVRAYQKAVAAREQA